MDAATRASDDDRHRVVTALQQHTEAGRLNLDEYAERVGAVWAARTLGELATVTTDLPATPGPAPAADESRRELLLLLAVAGAALLLLALFMAVTR
ncbi:DUF1707 SHOCT-like domain-containing protein [Melissospora conviva]|uniref:DUF1707 SHOCT-like domain-containing protein n=1 Tax=Melissospora conviva TaxID=3388432 RepID=UPI003B784B30